MVKRDPNGLLPAGGSGVMLAREQAWRRLGEGV